MVNVNRFIPGEQIKMQRQVNKVTEINAGLGFFYVFPIKTTLKGLVLYGLRLRSMLWKKPNLSLQSTGFMDDLLLIWSYFSMKQHNHGLIFSLINSTCYCFVEGWMGNFTTILCLIVLKVAEVWLGLTFSGKSIWSWHFPGIFRHSSVWKKVRSWWDNEGCQRQPRTKKTIVTMLTRI